MRRPLLLLLLLAIGGGLVWLLLRDGSPTPPPTSSLASPRRPSPSPRGAAFQGELDPQGRKSTPQAAAFDPRGLKRGKGGHELPGLVVDERGKPVPGAWVAAYSSPFPVLDFETDPTELLDHPLAFSLEPLASVFADEEGRFRLDGVPGRTLYLVARSHQRLTPRRQLVAPGALDGGKELVVRTVAGASLRGTVVDAHGAPVAGAEVLIGPGIKYLLAAIRDRSFFMERVYTGPDGSFAVDAVPAGKPLTANAFADSLMSGIGEFGPLPVAQEGGVRVHLLPMGGLSGRIVDPDGKGIPHATVVAIPLDLRLVIPFVRDPRAWTELSAAEGQYRFPLLPHALYLLLAQGGGGRSAPQTARVSETASLAPDLILDTTRKLVGRVVDGAGKPVVKARVELSSIPEGRDPDTEGGRRNPMKTPGGLFLGAAKSILPELLPQGAPVWTDAAGRFEIAAWHDARLRVSAPGFVQSDYRLEDLGEDQIPVLQLFRPGAVEGVVMDVAARRPVRVYTLTGKRGDPVPADRGALEIQATGSIGGDGPTVGKARLGGPAWLRAKERLLPPWTSLRNELAATVLVDSPDGRFRIDGLLPGRWTFTAKAVERLAAKSKEVEVIGGDTATKVVIMLQSGATLSGRVSDAATRLPVGGAIVSAGKGEESVLQALSTGFGTETSFAESAPDGSFVLHGVAEGADHVNVLADGYAAASEGIPPLQAFEERGGIYVELKAGGSLTGQVTDRNGRPLPNRMVGAISIQAKDGHQTATDEEGRYRLEHLRPGSYFMMSADMDDESLFTGNLSTILGSSRIITAFVREGEESVVDIVDRAAGGCHWTGRVLAEGEPVPGANLMMLKTGNGGFLDFGFSTSRTDEAGEFAFKSLEPGEYLLQLDTGDWKGGIPVVVPDLPEDHQVIRIPQGRVIGRVAAARDGRPIPGATVELVREDVQSGFGIFSNGGTARFASTDEKGAFALEGVPPGDWHAEVSGGRAYSASNEASKDLLGTVKSASFTLSEDQTQDLDLLLLPESGAIRVHLRDAEGKAWDRGFLLRAKRKNETNQVFGSGAQGAVGGLEPGEWDVQVSSQGMATVSMPGVEVRSGEFTDLDLTLAAGIELRVRVLDSAGQPTSASKIQLFDHRGKQLETEAGISAFFARMVGGGEVRLGSFPPGDYQLHVERDQDSRDLPLTLVAGDPVSVEVRF